MTVLSAQSIRAHVRSGQLVAEHPEWGCKTLSYLNIIPYEDVSKQYKGKSYGLTAAGYDIRLGKIRHPQSEKTVESVWMEPNSVLLAASFEHVQVPDWLQVIVHDKSSWAREFLTVQNTVLEPGWAGHITLEITNHSKKSLHLQSGMAIAQLVFHKLDGPTILPYVGKYQNQSDEPTPAIDGGHDGE